MNCRHSSTPPLRRTWAWLKTGLLGAALALFGSAQAQTVNNYSFTEGTETYTALGGTNSTATGDDGSQTGIPIGFNFTYNGTVQTTFNINTNGWLWLGGTTPGGSVWVNNLNNTSYPNAIAPFWDDNNRNTGAITYSTTGAPGSQVLTVDWNNINIGGSGATSATLFASFKVRLYETTNVIEFVYAPTMAAAGTLTASVGLNGTPGTTFLSVTPAATSTVSSVTANNAISATTNVVGKKFTFTPPATCTSLPSLAGGAAAASVASGCGSVATSTLSVTGSSAAASLTYQWRSGPPGGPYTTNLGTAATQVVTAVTSTTAYVRDIICTGGPASATSSEAIITVNPTITAGVSASPTGPFCPPVNTTLTATGGLTYAWAPATGLSATTGNIVTCTAASTTTYTVTATGVGGCTGTANVTVTVNQPPSITSVTANPNPTCFNGNSQLNVTAYTPAPVNQYSFTSTIGTFTSIVGAPGTVVINTGSDDSNYGTYPLGFTFVYNGTSYTSAGVNANGFVSMGALPTSSYTALSSGATNNVIAALNNDLLGLVANGSTMVYQLSGSPGSRVFTFEWANWGIYNAGAANNEFSFQVKLYEGTNVVQCVYKNNTATGSINAQVGLRGSSNAVFSNRTTATDWTATTAGALNTDVCAITATVRPVTGLTFTWAPPTPTYLWTPNTFLNFDNISNPLASGINVASQAYTVTATNAAGCSSQGTVTVTTSAPITAATITGNLGYCTGLSTTLTAVPADGGGPFTYLWAPGGQTTAAISVNAAGTYSAQVTDACGGSVNTGNVNVVENSLPTVAVDVPSTNFCTGYPQIALTASGASTYSWAPATGLSATTGTSVNANPTATTTYTVTGTDGNGCVNTATSAITVLGAMPVITSTTSVSPICPGSTSQLQVNLAGPAAYCATSYSTGTGFGDYLSSVSIGGTSLASTSGASATPYYTLFPASGSTTATLAAGSPYSLVAIAGTYTSNDVAVWIDYNQDGVFQEPGEKLGEVDNIGASPATATINFTVPAGALTGTARMRVREADQGTTGLMSACGALSFGEVEDYTITITGGAAPFTYAWTPAGNLNDATIANPVATLSTSEAYTVTVTNGAGCVALGTTSVSVPTVDDGDPCTLDACASGVVTHTFQDADSDGICDANDPCPNLANLVNGDPCDDGNVCTINDVVAGCVCAGTFQDTDLDGVCDANDNCPLVAGQIGSACDDGDPLTTGDVLNASCVCAGLAVDCEGTPSGPAVPGTPCNDADPCTLNDTWSPSCVCVGTYTDTDSDGICDTNDNCPTLFGVQGDACSDGNACTINDVITASCVCAGTPAPVTAGVTASSPVYCTPAGDVTLTATGGDTYSWAPAAGLSATTGSPVIATPASATTYTVTASNTVGCTGTATVTVTTGAFPVISSTTATPSTVCPGSNSQLEVTTPISTYCIPSLSFGCSFPDQISNVVVAGISRTSGCDNLSGSNGYSYFSGGPSGTLVAGSAGNAYSITTSGDTEGATIWIDYNQNGTFDVGEQIFNSYAGTSPATYSGTFTVPAGAINGVTRLRVRCTYAQAPGTSACTGAQTTYGETEDYNVLITGGASPLTYSWTPATYLSSTTISNPVATAVMTTTPYTVSVSNASGCTTQGTVTVGVETTDTDGDLTVDCLDGCPLDANKTAPGQCGCGVADTDTDGDLTADCVDGCPADPNKIAPGVCGCGVADTDTDGDLTADCNDACPTDPNKIAPGQCGCGVADTDTDSDGVADCIDSCPSVPGVVGTPCNDGNAGTINDVLTAGCVCAGTVPVCTFNTVLLDLVTDQNGGQTSWDVVNVGTTTVVCSGSGYLNNQTITLDCCLPNGCYELRVFDSAGDGMANGPVGGYVLRAPGAGNKRIIDNSGDGIFTSTSQIANNLGFCVPIGTDAPIASSCDKNNWLPNDILQATTNPAVTGQFGVSNATSGYQFWFFNPDGGYSRRILQTHAAPGSVTGPAANVRASYLRLNAIVTQPLPFYTNLNIRIRTQVAGVFSEFGPACRFRLDPPCSTTQLTTVADPVVSCGATGLTLSSTIYATTVAGASTYQFEFSKPGYLRRISQSVRSTALSFVTNPLQNNNCYSVRLRVSFDGGLTFCPFGPSCNITIGTALCGSAMMLDAADGIGQAAEGQLTVWPNPNDGSLVNVSLTEFDVNVNTVGVDVTDIYGKLVSTRTIPVQDGYLKTTMTFEQDLAPGLYLVNLTVGDKRYTERLVIQ